MVEDYSALFMSCWLKFVHALLHSKLAELRGQVRPIIYTQYKALGVKWLTR